MRWIPVHERVKVPVIKNVIWASKILFKADKWFLISAVLGECASTFFSLFLQSVLLLRVLLSIIQGGEDFSYYVKNLIGFLLLGILTEIISVWGDYVSQVNQKKVFKQLNNMIFEKASEADINCYENPEFYDKYQRATDVVTRGYFVLFSYSVSILAASVLTLISVISLVTAIDPAYLFFLVPVVLVFVVELFKSKVVYNRDLQMTTNDRIKAYTQRTVYLKEFSKDMRTSNIFSVIINRFNRAIERNIYIIKNYGMKLFLYSMVSSLFGEFIPTIGTCAYAGYQFIATNELDASGFSVVLSSINSVSNAATNIADCFAELSEVALYFQNLRDFLEYENEVVSGDKEVGDFESLEFKNVSFKYPSAQDYSIKNLNLKITKGQTAAIVGINGAGKSTLVKLLLRFYDPNDGEILYNGINIKEYEIHAYRRKFGTVFQDYKTFALSVNENIMCRECDDKDREIAESAMEKSGAWSKISTFPDKGDTVLTREFEDDGAGLSGGETQKTAVARMFAKDFDIAVLDEPSSALDPIAEYKMYESLIEATENKTVIYISHRLSSAVLSDIIYVMDNGTVTESGNHQALLKSGGEYSKMFTLQASAYNSDEEFEKEANLYG